jgi:hypothetical protein
MPVDDFVPAPAVWELPAVALLRSWKPAPVPFARSAKADAVLPAPADVLARTQNSKYSADYKQDGYRQADEPRSATVLPNNFLDTECRAESSWARNVAAATMRPAVDSSGTLEPAAGADEAPPDAEPTAPAGPDDPAWDVAPARAKTAGSPAAFRPPPPFRIWICPSYCPAPLPASGCWPSATSHKLIPTESPDSHRHPIAPADRRANRNSHTNLRSYRAPADRLLPFLAE